MLQPVNLATWPDNYLEKFSSSCEFALQIVFQLIYICVRLRNLRMTSFFNLIYLSLGGFV